MIEIDFHAKQVKVNGEARFVLRRNFHVYDVKDPTTGRYVLKNVPKDELQTSVERMMRFVPNNILS